MANSLERALETAIRVGSRSGWDLKPESKARLTASNGRVSRRVKVIATDGANKANHKRLQLGIAKNWLQDGVPFFVGGNDGAMLDAVMPIYFNGKAERVVILPVGLAELIARLCAGLWYGVPTKNGGRRSPVFYSLPFFVDLQRESYFWEPGIRDLLLRYEGNWSVLNLPSSELRALGKWAASVLGTVKTH